jgi:hypothetical protein
MIPPSPRLSARMTKMRYLKETTKLSDQKISDSTPSTFSLVGEIPYSGAKHSLSAYSGLVPISPYTTPSAPRLSARNALRLLPVVATSELNLSAQLHHSVWR